MEFVGRFEVEWKPFSDEIFRQAKSSDKMIFLHIGRLGNPKDREKVSRLFSDKDIIDYLNRYFISVIADEEDVPEASLMGWNILQINNEAAATPINMFLMPDFTPITSTSNCDPDDISLLLDNLLTAFQEKRSALSGMAQEAKMLLETTVFPPEHTPEPIEGLLESYADDWSIKLLSFNNYFKKKPFILQVPSMLFLLEYADKKSHPIIKGFVETVLDKIIHSAMYDTIDGGFFYEMEDCALRQPKWEKRLNDNALLVLLLIKGYLMFGKEEYRWVAQETISFIERCMKGQFGTFIYSLNIDSGEDKSDYYRFSFGEIKSAFGLGAMEIALSIGVDPSLDENIMQTPIFSDSRMKMKKEELETLRNIRKRHSGILQDSREITSYNLLFSSVLCLSSQILGNESLLHKSIELHQKVILNAGDENHHLSRYPVSSGYFKIEGNLSDYADLISTDITLYHATGEEYYLTQANDYLRHTMGQFYNESSGMFFKNSKYSTFFPMKMESNVDTDKPSTNSIMCDNLLRMYLLSGDEKYMELYKRQINNIASHLVGSGPHLGNWARLILKYVDSCSQLPK